MRLALLVLALTGWATGSALAGSLPAPAVDPQVAPPVLPAPDVHSWRGGYVGLHLQLPRGGHELRFRNLRDPGWDLGSDTGLRGAGAGIYGGYNWQGRGRLVVGVEAEVNLSRANGTSLLTHVDGTVLPFEVHRARVSQTAALRLRLGVAHDRTLLYAAIGAAVARLNFEIVDAGVQRFSNNRTRTGVIAALGVERAMARGWTFRVEWRHTNYGRIAYALDELPNTLAATSRLYSSDVMIGVSRRF